MVENKIPTSYNEALKILATGSYQVLNGGTDLMVRYRGWSETRVKFKKNMLHIHNLDELNYITSKDEYIHIGATTTHETILHHPLIPEIMKKCLRVFASPAIRNMGTLVGNIGNASPAGDAVLIAYLLEARLVVESLRHQREVPIEDFIKGPGSIALAPDEIIKEIYFKKLNFNATYFTKVGGRQSDAISKVMFAAGYRLDADKIVDIRIAIGAVSPTIIKDKTIEKSIKGYTLKNLSNQKSMILSQYAAHINPIDDQRSNKHYRKKVALNLLEAFLNDIITRS